MKQVRQRTLLLLLLTVELGDLLLNVGVESLFLSGQLA